VRVLDDPVTVSEEKGCICHCAERHEKAQSDDDPQVRKPAENDWWMASEEGLMTMSLHFLCCRSNRLIVRLLLDEAGVFLLLCGK